MTGIAWLDGILQVVGLLSLLGIGYLVLDAALESLGAHLDRSRRERLLHKADRLRDKASRL